jgi:hypothetical protein
MKPYDTSLTIMNNEPFKPNTGTVVPCGVDCPLHADTVISGGLWALLGLIGLML